MKKKSVEEISEATKRFQAIDKINELKVEIAISELEQELMSDNKDRLMQAELFHKLWLSMSQGISVKFGIRVLMLNNTLLLEENDTDVVITSEKLEFIKNLYGQATQYMEELNLLTKNKS